MLQTVEDIFMGWDEPKIEKCKRFGFVREKIAYIPNTYLQVERRPDNHFGLKLRLRLSCGVLNNLAISETDILTFAMGLNIPIVSEEIHLVRTLYPVEVLMPINAHI